MLFTRRTLLAIAAAVFLAVAGTEAARLARPVRFDRHQVVRLPHSTALLNAAYALGLDVWGKTADHVDLRVGPGQLEKLQAKIGQGKLQAKVLVSNVQALIDAETAQLRQQDAAMDEEPAIDQSYFKQYHRYDSVVSFMRGLATKYPDLVSFVPSIGKTAEGRDIAQIRVTSRKGEPKGQKKSFWIQGQQHAREWIAGITVLYLGWAFASRYGSDATVTSILDKFEFILVPMVNVDGIEYSWDTNRLWRKTRQTINGQKYGVDINRNWPDHWGKGGGSSNPSSDIYMGPSAGSEPEVRAIMASYSKEKNMVAAIDFHSYSELILRPYGWTQQRSPDDAPYARLGEVIKVAIQSKGEHAYTNQRIVDLYVASGGASDWFAGASIPKGQEKTYGISIELSPSQSEGGWGGQGFMLPKERIIPVAESMVPAVLKMAEYALNNPLGKAA